MDLRMTIGRALAVLRHVVDTIRSDPSHAQAIPFHYRGALVAAETLAGQIEDASGFPNLMGASKVRWQVRWRVSCISDGPQSWPLDRRAEAQAFADAHDEVLELEVRTIATYGTQDVLAGTLGLFDPNTGEQIP